MTGNEYQEVVNTQSSDPKADIKEPLERIVSGIINVLGSDVYTSDAILIILFNHIDLLGQLLTGDSSRANRSKWAVNFIRTYLGKVDEKYAMAGGFIYYMLGNGYVHKSYPGSFNTSDGRILKIQFPSTQERREHLLVTQFDDDELRLIFSINLFYNDLLDAIDLYCRDMTEDRSLQEKYRLGRNQLTIPGDRFQINNHAYILASDLGFINDQIS
jgi:hypothetical protein